jgi:acetyltransferase-like isoleucine patch superfamily enzyme
MPGPDFVAAGTPVTLAPGATITDKLRMFLGHYDLRVYLSDTGYIDIGRGSFDAASRLAFVQKTHVGSFGTVGQFCDFSESCLLFAGGEHRNDLPINVTLSNVPAFNVIAAKNGITDFHAQPPRPFHIGDAVVLSADAKVLSGAHIPSGTLLAAGTVASGELESFALYGGIPARKIRDRLTDTIKEQMIRVRWWDFDMVYMGNHLAQLQALSTDTRITHVYRQATPRFVLKMSAPQDRTAAVQILGFLQDEQLRPLTDAPQAVRDYITQLAGPGPYRWMPNVWADG